MLEKINKDRKDYYERCEQSVEKIQKQSNDEKTKQAMTVKTDRDLQTQEKNKNKKIGIIAIMGRS